MSAAQSRAVAPKALDHTPLATTHVKYADAIQSGGVIVDGAPRGKGDREGEEDHRSHDDADGHGTDREILERDRQGDGADGETGHGSRSPEAARGGARSRGDRIAAE